MGLSKAPTRFAAALLGRNKMAAGCIVWMRGKNANRCASFVSVGTLSWSVPAEIAEMAETGSQTKTWIYADFIGLSREKDWCCQTGLNCRPLHYQWSALPLSYGSMPGSENRPKRPLQAGRSLPQGPRSRKRADGRRGSQNGQNQPGRPKAGFIGSIAGRSGSLLGRQIRARASWGRAARVRDG
jgi:hypothetical protein